MHLKLAKSYLNYFYLISSLKINFMERTAIFLNCMHTLELYLSNYYNKVEAYLTYSLFILLWNTKEFNL